MEPRHPLSSASVRSRGVVGNGMYDVRHTPCEQVVGRLRHTLRDGVPGWSYAVPPASPRDRNAPRTATEQGAVTALLGGHHCPDQEA